MQSSVSASVCVWLVLMLLSCVVTHDITVVVVSGQPTDANLHHELVGLIVRQVAPSNQGTSDQPPPTSSDTGADEIFFSDGFDSTHTVDWLPLPLRTTEVESQVIDFCGEVNLTQTYINPTPFMLEAEYIFPLDENSAVTGFTAEINGRILVGVVKEKEVARHEFEVAKSRGQSTMLFEQQKENIFKIQIGNLPPNTTCKIKLTYITTLDLEGKTNRFVLPAIVAPKYDPSRYFGAEKEDGSGYNGQPYVQLQPRHDLQFFEEIKKAIFGDAPKTKSKRPQTTVQFKQQHAGPQEFRMKLDVQMPSQITQIQSLTHPDQVKILIDDTNSTPTGPYHATITFGLPMATEPGSAQSPSSSLNGRDFVLTTGQKDYLRTRAVLEIDPLTGSQAVQLAFAPQSLDLMDAAALQTEIIFVIDQSGSMQGSSIEGVRQALEVFMKSLPNACKFNLISFGSSYHQLFPQSQLYSKEAVQTGLDYVRAIQADMGGTEIYYPLKVALESPADPNYPKHIFLLTDGEVTNTQQLVDLVRQHSHTNRLFTFGLGLSADRHLVKELAKAGNGECEFIAGGSSAMEKQDVTSKVMRNLIRSFQTTFNQAHIDWSATLLGRKTIQQSDDTRDFAFEAIQAPVVIPPISPPNRSLIYGLGLNAPDNGTEVINLIVTANTNRPVTELVKDDTNPNRLTWTIPLNLTQAIFSRFIHKLGARTRISEIQNWSSNHPNYANQKNEILKLSLKYQLLSSFSSFIIVDEANEPVPGIGGSEERQSTPPIPTAAANLHLNFQSFGGAILSSASLSVPSSAPGRLAAPPLIPHHRLGSYRILPNDLHERALSSAPTVAARSPHRYQRYTDVPPHHAKRTPTHDSHQVHDEAAAATADDDFAIPDMFHSVINRAPDRRDQTNTLVRTIATVEGVDCTGSATNVHTTTGDSLLALIDLVSIDGLWSLTEPWLNIIQACLHQSQSPICTQLDLSSLDQLSTAISKPSTVVATSLSLWCLETFFRDRSMEFAVLVGKSKGELRRAYGIETDKLAQITQEIITKLQLKK